MPTYDSYTVDSTERQDTRETSGTGITVSSDPTVLQSPPFGGPQTTTPTAPVVEAYGEGRNVRLVWDHQTDLTNFSRYELQVGASATGPWFALENNGSAWKAGAAGGLTSHPAEEYLHVAVPLGGTTARPTSVTLHYRVRRVTKGGQTSDWSGVVSATAIAISKGDLAADIVDAAKVDPASFLRGIDAGLVAYWSLDDVDTSESTHTTPDNTGNGHELTVYGSPTRIAGISGEAIDFPDSQTTKYIERPSFAGLNGASALSISCWLDTDTDGGTVLLHKAGSTTVRLSITSTGSLRWQVGGRVGTYASAGLTSGGWRHVLVTWQATSAMNAWIDGVQVTLTATGTGPSSLSSAGLLRIGNTDPRTNAEAYDGKLDECRIYDRALDEAEIKFFKLVPAGPQPGMIIADRLIARSITSRELESDLLRTIIGHVQTLFVGPHQWGAVEYDEDNNVEGKTRGYLDNDEVTLQRRASSTASWSGTEVARLLSESSGGSLWLYNVARTLRTLITKEYIRLHRTISNTLTRLVNLQAHGTVGGSLELYNETATKRIVVRAENIYFEEGSGSSWATRFRLAANYSASPERLSFYYGAKEMFRISGDDYISLPSIRVRGGSTVNRDIGESGSRFRHLYLKGKAQVDDILLGAPSNGYQGGFLWHDEVSSSNSGNWVNISPNLEPQSDRDRAVHLIVQMRAATGSYYHARTGECLAGVDANGNARVERTAGTLSFRISGNRVQVRNAPGLFGSTWGNTRYGVLASGVAIDSNA